MSDIKNQTLTLTPEALQAMISSAVATAIQEAKKPAPPSEQELAAVRQANELRAETANNVVKEMERKRFIQMTCSHKHATGESHCVHVKEEVGAGYILCQKCQAKIRTFVEPEKQTDKNSFYDTEKFNLLFQEISRTDM
jgi:hypothetical protein